MPRFGFRIIACIIADATRVDGFRVVFDVAAALANQSDWAAIL